MCTNISIPRKSDSAPLISARTMDWFEADPAIVNFVPRGQSFPETDLPDEIQWINKYAFVGAGYKVEGIPISYSDGLNEEGLSAAGLWLSCSKYPERNLNKPLLYNYNLIPYMLGNFKDINEVREALPRLNILDANDVFPKYPSLLHYIISDAGGNHMIVEFVNSRMHIYITKMGVLTNQPTYDWQITNLGLYGQLSLKDNTNIVCGEQVTGSGQLGIPGDPMPQSRFVRAAFLRQTAFQAKSAQEAIGVARQILQTLSVPIGTVIMQSPYAFGSFDWTQWSIIRDHTNLSYYFYSDFNSNLYGIQLKELNLNGSEQMHIDIVQPDWYENVSGQLKPGF